MGYDVFISYSTQDKLTADAVCAILESNGIRCWIAPRDIPLGADWTESLVSAIESAPIMVLVFSAHANESHQIKREVNLAVDNGLTVIPVRVEDVMPSKSLKFSININHWLDAFPPPLDNHLQNLARSIRAHLDAARTAQAENPMPPAAAAALATGLPQPSPMVATPPPAPVFQHMNEAPSAVTQSGRVFRHLAASAGWVVSGMFVAFLLVLICDMIVNGKNEGSNTAGGFAVLAMLVGGIVMIWLSAKGKLPGTGK